MCYIDLPQDLPCSMSLQSLWYRWKGKDQKLQTTPDGKRVYPMLVLTPLGANTQEAEEQNKTYDLLMYGDNFVEAWRGTFLGSPWTMFSGGPLIWSSIFGKQYNAAAFGIAGASPA